MIANQNQLRTIRNFTFKYAENLEVLILSSNSVCDLELNAFKGNLTRLNIIELDKNKLTILAKDQFFSVQNLQTLNLAQNRISLIETSSFNGLNNLVNLYLDTNLLTIITCDTFANLPNLKYLTLHNNQIKSIEKNSLASMQLTLFELDLHSNQYVILIK